MWGISSLPAVSGNWHERSNPLYPHVVGFCMPIRIPNVLIGETAMEIVEAFEIQQNRIPTRVHRDGVGYDLRSVNSTEERFIEVKGSGESWTTHTWQSLYKSEVQCLNEFPEKFFLYFIHFDIAEFPSSYQLFVLSGFQLLNDGFRIEPESYALRPISRARLNPYEVSVDKLVVD
jgi:hypothetical protein